MADPFTCFLSFLFLSLLLVVHFVRVEAYERETCHPSSCGIVPKIKFPFSSTSNLDCGLYNIKCHNYIPTINFEEDGQPYVVKSITCEARQLIIQDSDLLRADRSQICDTLHNSTLPVSPFLTFKSVSRNYTLFNCERGDATLHPDSYKLYNYSNVHRLYSLLVE